MRPNKIKVVWICHFSDKKTRDCIKFDKFYYKTIIKKILLKPIRGWQDYAVWNSNAITEFEKFDDIDLTIIFPHAGIKGDIQEFSLNGINYICFRSEDDYLGSFIINRITKSIRNNYPKNRKLIIELISRIKPDIVHVIGAENPYYSMAALDIPDNIPSIVSLQTLISDPNFKRNYPIREEHYNNLSSIESNIIKSCDYIATPVQLFQEIIKDKIKPNAIFLNISLAVGQDIDTSYMEKKYDFVYFAANINKAGDFAIEAFALAHHNMPEITLNVSGSFSADFKAKLDKRITELGISDSVIFTGSQPTHDDVLRQIKKSRFAILPLKIDLVSGTIREAMACGLPVITTITPATPDLNRDRESVLLSEKGDFQAMANNMIRLLKDEKLACRLKENGIRTVHESYSNERNMEEWRKTYYDIIDIKYEYRHLC